MSDRILSLTDKETVATLDELHDLVEWTPEITADTDLSESDWLPIYEHCESITSRHDFQDWDQGLKDDSQQLCELLKKALETLEEIEAQFQPANDSEPS